MRLQLIPLREEHVKQFKSDMQEAFQQGAVEGFGEMEEELCGETDYFEGMFRFEKVMK